MQKIKTYLQTFDIKEGVSYRGKCPACGRANTFTATKQDGVILYHCYSLSCGVKGAHSEGMTAQEIMNRLNSKDTPKDTQEVFTLVWPEYVVQPSAEHTLMKRFVSRWELEHEDLMYDVKDRRAVIPIYYKGGLIDAVGRALDGAIPKWYRYSGVADVYKRIVGNSNGIVIIVEDVISAITAAKLVPGLTGMAILGTSLSPAVVKHLDGYYKVIIALDPDAAHKTLQYKREVEAWTGLETHALRLDDDLKYRVCSDLTKLKEIV